MIGGFMSTKLKEMFQLTDKGVKGLIKASVSSFFLYVGYMLPLVVVLYFIQGVINSSVDTMGFYLLVSILVAIIMTLVIYINYNTLYAETYKESKNLRIDIANILKNLPLSYFSKHDISDLSQTIMKDVEAIEHALSHAIPQAIGLVFFLGLTFITMLINNSKMAIYIMGPILVSFLLLVLSKKLQVYGSTKYYNQLRTNSEKFQEAIELQQEIKSYGQVDRIKKDLLDEMEKSEKIHIISEAYQAFPLLLSTSVLKLAFGLTILLGTRLYLAGEISLILFVASMMGSSKIIFTVEGLYQNISEIMYLDSRISRIRELRNAEVQTGKSKDLKKYNIELRDVVFGYSEDNRVIDGVSFTARQNEVTAIVGPSGCGKTSLLRLMSRLYDYDDGSIIIDGEDIRDIDTDSLFDKISIVFQDVMLFNSSIMENIRLGNRNASDEEVLRAAELSNCNEFVDRLPDGYETVIGENGGKLSGGERQRISIARAILKDTPIILLDEISASLDVENEMKIQESLNTLIKNKTVVIISHRLKSIENADQIVVMNKGKVDGVGSHQELLNKSSLYKNMIDKSNMTENYLY